jgi:organic hydroperoxide reductase OsmC/OhrA
LAANKFKLKPTSVEIEVAAGIGDDGSGFGLAVGITAWVSGISEDDANKLIAAAHEFCPYSKATRGNIEHTLKVIVV